MKAYYDRRAPEYDDWWLGRRACTRAGAPRLGRGASTGSRRRSRALPPARTLDVACGTGFLTRHLRGEVVGLDPSERMLEVARAQAPGATLRAGRRALASRSRTARSTASSRATSTAISRPKTVRGSCRGAPRRAGARRRRRRSAGEVDDAERWEERRLKDGSRWTVYKRVLRRPGPRRTSLAARSCSGALVRRRRALDAGGAPPTGRSPRCNATCAAAEPASRRASRSSRCRSSNGYLGQRAYMYGQAPGIVEGRRAPPVARTRRQDASPLARARRGRVLPRRSTARR